MPTTVNKPKDERWLSVVANALFNTPKSQAINSQVKERQQNHYQDHFCHALRRLDSYLYIAVGLKSIDHQGDRVLFSSSTTTKYTPAGPVCLPTP